MLFNAVIDDLKKTVRYSPEELLAPLELVRLTDIGRINDSFVGLAGPHPSRSITNAILKHRNPEVEKAALESPILKVIK